MQILSPYAKASEDWLLNLIAKSYPFVIPAKAGIHTQERRTLIDLMDSGFRRNDGIYVRDGELSQNLLKYS
jgi:hypothetical protein